VSVVLPVGERLIRVHKRAHSPEEFISTVLPPEKAGRFDTVDGTYGHIYTAATSRGAIAEGVLQGALEPTSMVRSIPRSALADRAMTELELLGPARLISLRGPDVGHVCQSAWLTKCEATDYTLTQAWGAAIRGWHTWAAGFIWWARKNEHELVHVLYDDRLPKPALRPIGPSVPIDSGPGLDLVRTVLAAHNVGVI
jgi:hypothetical protein